MNQKWGPGRNTSNELSGEIRGKSSTDIFGGAKTHARADIHRIRDLGRTEGDIMRRPKRLGNFLQAKYDVRNEERSYGSDAISSSQRNGPRDMVCGLKWKRVGKMVSVAHW